jgi:uncharacterized DUF497 family protein
MGFSVLTNMRNVHTSRSCTASGTKPSAGQFSQARRKFSDAVGALENLANLTIADPDAAGEARFITLGMDFLSRVVLVIWTERAADRIRIISARKVSSGETRRYHGA